MNDKREKALDLEVRGIRYCTVGRGGREGRM